MNSQEITVKKLDNRNKFWSKSKWDIMADDEKRVK